MFIKRICHTCAWETVASIQAGRVVTHFSRKDCVCRRLTRIQHARTLQARIETPKSRRQAERYVNVVATVNADGNAIAEPDNENQPFVYTAFDNQFARCSAATLG